MRFPNVYAVSDAFAGIIRPLCYLTNMRMRLILIFTMLVALPATVIPLHAGVCYTGGHYYHAGSRYDRHFYRPRYSYPSSYYYDHRLFDRRDETVISDDTMAAAMQRALEALEANDLEKAESIVNDLKGLAPYEGATLLGKALFNLIEEDYWPASRQLRDLFRDEPESLKELRTVQYDLSVITVNARAFYNSELASGERKADIAAFMLAALDYLNGDYASAADHLDKAREIKNRHKKERSNLNLLISSAE